MDEAKTYADMLEIPVETTSVTVKQTKRKRKPKTKTDEEVKNELIEKVNDKLSEEKPETVEVKEESVVITKKEKKKFPVKKLLAGLGLTAITAGAMVGTWFLSDTLNLKEYFSGLFNNEEAVVKYTDFSATLPCSASNVKVEDGVMTVENKGAVYASADGKVTGVDVVDGKYVLSIMHSRDFITKIEGLTYCYANVGETVYGNIPVGYSDGEKYTVCFYSGDGMITDYDISTGAVIWNESEK